MRKVRLGKASQRFSRDYGVETNIKVEEKLAELSGSCGSLPQVSPCPSYEEAMCEVDP